jgi:hypothetical protein
MSTTGITQDESLAAILASATLGDTIATLKQLIATGAQLQVPQIDAFFAFVDQHPSDRDALLAQVLPQHPTFDFISRALRSGMPPTTSIAVDDATSLSLPCYLAHKRQLLLLLRLLREGGLSLSACGSSADYLWPHLQLAEDELPVLCELMEHLAQLKDVKEPVPAGVGAAAATEEAEPEAKANASTEVTINDSPYALPSAAFTKWLSANPSLLPPLAAELLNHPQLAKARRHQKIQFQAPTVYHHSAQKKRKRNE